MEFLKGFVDFIIHDDLSAIPIALIFLFIMMGIDSKRIEENERRRTKRPPDGATRCPQCGEGVVGFLGPCEICGYKPPRR